MYKTKLEVLQKVLGDLIGVYQIRKTKATVLEYENGEILISYGVVACIHTYGTDPRYNWWFTNFTEYSITTKKHVKEFSGLNAKQRREGLKNGKFAYVKLSK